MCLFVNECHVNDDYDFLHVSDGFHDDGVLNYPILNDVNANHLFSIKHAADCRASFHSMFHLRKSDRDVCGLVNPYRLTQTLGRLLDP